MVLVIMSPTLPMPNKHRGRFVLSCFETVPFLKDLKERRSLFLTSLRTGCASHFERGSKRYPGSGPKWPRFWFLKETIKRWQISINKVAESSSASPYTGPIMDALWLLSPKMWPSQKHARCNCRTHVFKRAALAQSITLTGVFNWHNKQH